MRVSEITTVNGHFVINHDEATIAGLARLGMAHNFTLSAEIIVGERVRNMRVYGYGGVYVSLNPAACRAAETALRLDASRQRAALLDAIGDLCAEALAEWQGVNSAYVPAALQGYTLIRDLIEENTL